MTKQKHYKIKASTFSKKGRLLSIGFNSYVRTHPIQAHFASLVGEPHRIYLHAEIQAILRAKDQRIHTLVVESFNGPPPFPCAICQAAIKAYGISVIEVKKVKGN